VWREPTLTTANFTSISTTIHYEVFLVLGNCHSIPGVFERAFEQTYSDIPQSFRASSSGGMAEFLETFFSQPLTFRTAIMRRARTMTTARSSETRFLTTWITARMPSFGRRLTIAAR
jgi:hypothetical protein